MTQSYQNNFYSIIIIFSLLFAISLSQTVPCHQFGNRQCIRCPVGSHLYQQLCFKDIIGCQSYANGDQCTKCDTSISQLRGNTCVLTNPDLVKLNAQQLRFRTNIGDQYGSPQFVLISISEAQSNTFFKRVDNWMRTSQYSFHISRAVNPLVSVHTYIIGDVQHFKILYQGAGGGLFLCIIQTNMKTDSVTLSSFVAIGKSRIVINCVQYDQLGQCRGCNNGYHLQNDLCYINVGACISYSRNICLRCYGFSYLIENRCVADCKSLSDCRSNLYYLGRASSDAIASQTGKVIDTTISNGNSNNNGSSGNLDNKKADDPNCASYDSNLNCVRCSFRFFKNNNGICQAISPLCNQFNSQNGKCTACYQGYKLSNGQCQLQKSS